MAGPAHPPHPATSTPRAQEPIQEEGLTGCLESLLLPPQNSELWSCYSSCLERLPPNFADEITRENTATGQRAGSVDCSYSSNFYTTTHLEPHLLQEAFMECSLPAAAARSLGCRPAHPALGGERGRAGHLWAAAGTRQPFLPCSLGHRRPMQTCQDADAGPSPLPASRLGSAEIPPQLSS